MASVLALPLVGGLVGRPGVAGADMRPALEVDVEAEAVLWEYLDHASSWDETVHSVRAYVSDGEPDAEVFAAVADAIERRASGVTAEGVLGLYPATVLMLASLRHLKLYGSADDYDAQVALISSLMTED
jgi:hypothetical protein